ncbi:hypothetical protein H1R20_g7367, partial [Candolleomyces eurysporus]
MAVLAKLVSALALIPALVAGITVPGADTPLFYLVATGPDSAGVNFLPVRLHGGSPNYSSILTGNGPIGKFFLTQGVLVSLDPSGSTLYPRPVVNSVLTANGCSTYGTLGFVQGASSNKCARYSTFQIQSNPENAQLGAKLTLNWVGGFYVCGVNKEVVYKVSPGDGPTECTPIDLYTVPVVE